ncbi:MAG: hypothetical protein CSA89_01080 [Bacteroidales bacterium]|nr:MAG: hypothetical protein CSA89_01080 [Bacteroidales bacterium]
MENGRYDLIVCNPPYFENSLKCPDRQRTTARHTESLTYESLFDNVDRLLSETGLFAVIIPIESLSRFMFLAKKHKMFLIRQTNVYPTPTAKVKRVLLEFSKREKKTEETDLVIETSRHCYTEYYKQLTGDFYL